MPPARYVNRVSSHGSSHQLAARYRLLHRPFLGGSNVSGGRGLYTLAKGKQRALDLPHLRRLLNSIPRFNALLPPCGRDCEAGRV